MMVVEMMVVGVPVVILVTGIHPEFCRRHPGAQDAAGRKAAEIGCTAAQRAAQIVEREPEIEQRAEDHVARRAGKTVEIQRLRQPSTPSVLAEAVILHVRENHVIEHIYPHQDAGGGQTFGQPHVVFARLGIA